MYNTKMQNRKKRVYVDSSVVGGKFNTRLAEQTKPFWDAVERGEITIIVSDVLEDELEDAPARARNFYDSLLKSKIERIESTEESDSLAKRYIAENVVGESSLDDCRHIAIATIARADVLVSWNCTHIANIERSKGYNSVNEQLGYPRIEIRTPYPYEVIHDEN